ncbi:ABC transporter ATP-binding protein [Labedaea rhizosphaerae]|uniref:ATP-binding cassette subfamily B protein n=1 Tax=Labedaea rhizosphaerae TaxID=598644 RepID=A0A4R6SAU2_LABRH|nr:ABC transporter ATP-binding protein [Labedaea rhizosphaerae]TDP96653.1 ATP-binding cassette subfamily B protein [Labedaea rhizosphaerae]
MASRAGDTLLIEVARRRPGTLAAVVAASLVALVAGLLLPNALAGAVDAAISGRVSVVFLAVVGGLEVAGATVGGLLASTLTAQTTAVLRRFLVRARIGAGVRSPFAPGDAVSRLAGDCTNAGAIASIFVQLATSLVMSLGAIVLLALLDWRLALVFVFGVPPALVLARGHVRLTADDVLTYQRVSGEISARLLDAVRGLRTIAASGTAAQETSRVLRPLPELAAAGSGMWRAQASMVWRAALLYPAVELAVLAAAGFGVLQGRLSFGDVLAALGYVGLGMGLVGQIPVLTTLARARSSAERIAEVLDAPRAPHGTHLALPGPGAITFDHVGVAGILSDVEFTVPGGAVVAVVGRSGSGKSTVVGLIGGLAEPDRGRVLLDGVPVTDLRPEALRHLVAYAFERPALLGGSVADTVAYGTRASHDAIESACRAAQVHDLIVRLPLGYATPLAETPLSGGEAQRLGLARAVVRSPNVLVLDDATASLDTVTEARVTDALRYALPGRTRIVVTHRAATAARADHVVWLDNGKLRGFAAHQDLWADPDYRALFTGDDS